jgi:hypothetical protein
MDGHGAKLLAMTIGGVLTTDITDRSFWRGVQFRLFILIQEDLI